jgi:hypothetical protein
MAGLTLPYLFPFCVPVGEEWDGTTLFGTLASNESDQFTPVVGPGTKNPAGFTLEEIMSLYYRVKKIEIDYDIDIIEEQEDPDPDVEIPFAGTVSDIQMSGTFENEEGITAYVGISDEKAFACGPQTFVLLNNSSLNGVIMTLLMFVPNDLDAVMLQKDGLYYPTLEFYLQGVDDPFQSYFVDGSRDRQALIEIDFFGKTLRVYGQATQDLTGEMSFTPTEYWEYDPGDEGGPIWDEDDGSELRDPFSVQDA